MPVFLLVYMWDPFFSTLIIIFCAIHPHGKDGYSTLATLTARAGFKLYKIRPKLHMMCHLACLGFVELGKRMDHKNDQWMCHKNVTKKMLQ